MQTDRQGTPTPLPFYLNAALAALSRAPLHTIAGTLHEMLAGIDAWQSHPHRRPRPEHPVCWSAGAVRLFDHGGRGRPVLIVPSLINRSDILDLDPNRSLLADIRDAGFRPMQIDWGDPECGCQRDLSGHVADILAPALTHVTTQAGGPVPVVGYCIGGTLAAGLAATVPGSVSGLCLIGAPWSFGAATGAVGALRAQALGIGADRCRAIVSQIAAIYGVVPAEVFQLLFALIAPLQALQKFPPFAQHDPSGPDAARFVAVESWLNDPVHVGAAVARQLLIDWYLSDQTGRGRWRVGPHLVAPATLPHPVLAVSGRRDHIVSPAVAFSGAEFPRGQTLSVDAGHVGMIVGGAARDAAAQVCGFLQRLPVS